MPCRSLAGSSTTPGVATCADPVKLTVVSKDIVGKVKKDVEEFRDQIQYKRTELPEIWAKVQQYKDTIAVTGKLYESRWSLVLRW